MTDKMAKMVYAIATNPMYNNFAKESIRKLAETHLKLHHIGLKDKLNSTQIHNICKSHSKTHWCSFLDAILKDFRHNYANENFPKVLPSGSRLAAVDMIGKKYNREVEQLLTRMKAKEAKLHSQVRASVKRTR